MAVPWLIDARRVVQHYPDAKTGGTKIVLGGIDLRVRAGEIVSVVGPSGCGKSTLLRLILGAEKHKAGELLLDGAPPGPPNRDRGIVYQRYSLFPNLRVIENVVFGLELDKLHLWTKWVLYPYFRREHQKFLDLGYHYLEKVGLAEHAYKYPHQLSGGQQQRVAIAQALIMKPKIMLMDEPFGALDPGTRDRLQHWLLELHAAEPFSVFFVTHDLEEAVFLGTRAIALSQHYNIDGKRGEGARIVADMKTPNDKKLPEFRETVDKLLALGFDPRSVAEPGDFAMTHPDAHPAA